MKIKEGEKKISVAGKNKVLPRKVSEKKMVTDLQGNVIPNKVEEKKKENKIKKHFRRYRKLYMLVIGIIIAILIGILGYIGIRSYILNKKYSKYEKVMDRYGFSLMYNNESPESSQKITRIEMIKIILASIYNTTEVESIGFASRGEFEGDEWARTAVAFGIIDKDYITKDTYDEGVTYKEALITYLDARSKLKSIPVKSEKEASYKNLQAFSIEERNYINDAVENGILENSNKKLDIDNELYKGEFNKLVVTFVEKYNLIAPEGETLVVKKESKPSNYKEYPYILYSVDKAVYEYDGFVDAIDNYKNSAETYKHMKDYYNQMEYRSELFYTTLLNVDYNTIEKSEFYNTINNYSRYDYTNEIKEYIEYVKANKIIIEGKAETQLPIFYLDGIRYRARIKLTFEIKNSHTDKNLLLGDAKRSSEVAYKDKKYTVYIDAPMGPAVLSKALLLDLEPIVDLMVNNKEASNLNKF